MRNISPFLFIGLFWILALIQPVFAKADADSLMPIRGFCIAAPSPDGLDLFLRFIADELVPRKVNTLILRIDFNYQYQSHPELANQEGLDKMDMRKIVFLCQKHHIKLIPQINLLGHQSWAETPGNLLKVYPELDETPWVAFPETYSWPNADNLYCKSYCPLHPAVHPIIFDLIDEICEVCETDIFHAGMDEVFYIGEDKCPRCAGRDKAELFAGEVWKIRNYLAQKNRKLWIWGDRLLDGKATGLGMWEASYNNTHRAIDMIPKDVVICDWHYENPVPTAVYFAAKGFQVVTCPWKNPTVAVQQCQDMFRFRQYRIPDMSERFLGMAQTVWSSPAQFINAFYGSPEGLENDQTEDHSAECFRVLFAEMARLFDPGRK